MIVKRFESGHGDVQGVVHAASVLRVSEFEVFRLAYREWFGQLAADSEIDTVFGRYLSEAIVPVWVRDFTRKIDHLSKQGRLHVGEFGIRLPTPASPRMIFVGGMAFVIIVMIVTLLVYLAIRTEDLMKLGCQFPPCY